MSNLYLLTLVAPLGDALPEMDTYTFQPPVGGPNFFDTYPNPHTYFFRRTCVLPITRTDGVARIIPNSYATTGNHTQVSSVTPL